MSTSCQPVTVTRAGPEDLPAAVELFLGYLDFYARQHPRSKVAAFVGERLRRADSTLWLARIESGGEARLAGMAHVYPTFSTLSLAPSWTLGDLYVAPAERGAGVARSLLTTVREQAREAGAVDVHLETAVDNTPAQRLYESEGFAVERHFLAYGLTIR
jgi:ribosomal protein S18 acetylase RimI-like enzyme